VTQELLVHLEQLRSIIGRPIPITSGYRCPEHNLAVGGVPRSQHLTGRAADVGRARATVQQAMRAGFTGIGSDEGIAVHVDVRPGALARWEY
jgi:uncharacterized protein YcbK (DUF882 family)